MTFLFRLAPNPYPSSSKLYGNNYVCILMFGLQVDNLQVVKKLLMEERPHSFEDCVAWARLLFQDCFSNQIAQLLFNFPSDQTTSSGAPFWAGQKRCPHPLQFSVNEVGSFCGQIVFCTIFLSPVVERGTIGSCSSYCKVIFGR